MPLIKFDRTKLEEVAKDTSHIEYDPDTVYFAKKEKESSTGSIIVGGVVYGRGEDLEVIEKSTIDSWFETNNDE